MRHPLPRALLPALLVLTAVGGCRCVADPLDRPHPGLRVSPGEANLTAVPVTQDTRIAFLVRNDRTLTLHELAAELTDDSDPAFRLEEGTPDEVLPGQLVEVVVLVRPLVVSNIAATLIVTAQEDAAPRSRVEVPITVSSIDAGMPDICEVPESIEFDRIGRGDVARTPIPVKNCGNRDLILDEVLFEPEVAGDEAIRVNPSGPIDYPVGTIEQIALDFVFAPEDLERHCGDLVIRSNDPDEPEVRMPACGQAAECPIACAELVDGADGIEPFDTVRIDGRCSTPGTPDTLIEAWEWTQSIRPPGSTAVLSSTSADRVELPTDVPGEYCALLHVYDNTGVRSCEPAEVCFDVVPTEDLHIQLVWDHPDADLDLHVTRDDGAPFNHDTDVYFSNREPVGAPWSDDPEQNPRLDVDDDSGYGPENTNVVHPAANARFTVYAHYWRAQTDGDPRTTATVRVFVYGQQVIEVARTFEGDEQLWEALDIDWPAIQGAPATITQVGQVTPFPRPF
ncbi:MAG: hypothetical protein HYS27_25165 [Deltaproteobacteria bacterium]|nr:hypothetical protein [Deltaproteobacteria bacterium]